MLSPRDPPFGHKRAGYRWPRLQLRWHRLLWPCQRSACTGPAGSGHGTPQQWYLEGERGAGPLAQLVNGSGSTKALRKTSTGDTEATPPSHTEDTAERISSLTVETARVQRGWSTARTAITQEVNLASASEDVSREVPCSTATTGRPAEVPRKLDTELLRHSATRLWVSAQEGGQLSKRSQHAGQRKAALCTTSRSGVDLRVHQEMDGQGKHATATWWKALSRQKEWDFVQ